MNTFVGSNLNFEYSKDNPVLENINFTIPSGKLTVILGQNGSGKSTLVRLIMGLLPINKGEIFINNTDITTTKGLYYLRKHSGIVFQNPDNQFVSPILEDDICFGLGNHKVPESEHAHRIQNALSKVYLQGFEKRNLSSLSGGQKQRAAIAGILALEDDILIFDESTSMLDPDGKDKMLQCLQDLRSSNSTIIMVTQKTEEAIDADYILLIAEHQIIAADTPKKILTDIDLLTKAGVKIPFPVRVYYDLKKNGIILDHCPLTNQGLTEAICNSK